MSVRKSTEQVTLTLLATVGVLAVSACEDAKFKAVQEAACREDPQSENCLLDNLSSPGFIHLSGDVVRHGFGTSADAYGSGGG